MDFIQKPADLSLDFLKYLVSQKSASLHTLRAYARDLSKSFDLGPVNDQALTPLLAGEKVEPLDLFQRSPQKSSLELPKEGHPSSKNRRVAALKSLFKWAYDFKKLPQDYGIRLVCPKRPQQIPHFISVDEALSVLSSFKEVENHQEKALFLLLYGGGLRVSEACALKSKDILWDQKKILVVGKGNKERFISLPETVWKTLKKTYQKTEFLFGEKPLSTRKAYDWIRRAGVRANLLRPLHPHALRHSFATHLLSDGVNLRVLQSLLGHESLTATEKYTHLSIDQLARTMENLHPLGDKKATEV